MAEVTVSQPGYNTMSSRPHDTMGSTAFNAGTTTAVVPLPNPPFVFPMRSPPPEEQSGGAANGSRRPTNRSRPQRISVNDLSTFEFPPSSSDLTPTPNTTHSHSPSKSVLIPPRSGGHRRGGSEFIGGDRTASGPGLMSSSPTKSDGMLPPPQVSSLGPPGGRRGHAHRRSAAISNHDLSTILRPANEMRSGSAPTTPSDPNSHRRFLPSLDRSASQPTLSPSAPSPTTPIANNRESVPLASQSRPRVGFSDTVEFIPRPLSTISSETSSSLSTIRASHSVTGSISSILSASAPSPPSTRRTDPIFETPREYDANEKRPASAGALLDNPPLNPAFYSRASAPNRPSSASGPLSLTEGTLIADSLTQTDLFPGAPSTENISPKSSYAGVFLQHIASSKSSSQSLKELQKPQAEKARNHNLPRDRPRSSPEAAAGKRQRKVRSWAGSILSRKSKNRTPDDLRISSHSPTPLREFAPMDNFPLEEVNFDEDTTCVIHSPQYESHPPLQPDNPGWNPQESPSFQDFDSSSPVLDLDAALASLDGSDDDQSSSSGFSSAKRRMHSGGATGAFVGPGMHYHRRAESAPVMAPIDFKTFGIHRLGSNPAMADVFEEDEEDESHAQEGQRRSRRQSKSKDNTELEGLGVQIVDADDGVYQASLLTASHGSPNPDTSSREHLANEQPETVVIADTTEEPRFSVLTKSSDGSTVTPTLSQHQLVGGSLTDPMECTVANTTHYLDGHETTSSVSSPDFSTMSFDVPRLHTATSSITDRTTWSSSKPSDPPQWLSTEDVPSLTSSASTMISGPQPRFSTSAGSRPSGERSASFSAAVPRRVRPVSAGKRSSLASLSRLVSSSYGERSKLSIESRVPDETDRSDKKKGNRISRLMRFWKSKEKLVP